jgi:hypothetical protein
MMSPVTRPPTAAPAQRVCPHCARIAHTDARRCPFCRHAYTRRPLVAIAALLLVFAAGILGGTALILMSVGDRVEDEVTRQVNTVQRDLDRSVRSVGDDLADQLDERLRQNGVSTP